MIFRIVDKAAKLVAASRLVDHSFHRTFITMAFQVKEIPTKPFEGQKPGTSGLRKRCVASRLIALRLLTDASCTG